MCGSLRNLVDSADDIVYLVIFEQSTSSSRLGFSKQKTAVLKCLLEITKILHFKKYIYITGT